MDPKIAKWQRWIKVIEQEVILLNHYRRCNRVFEAIVNANPLLTPGNTYLDYFRNVYATYAAASVRRHARPHRDAISLAGLLQDLVRNPEALSRTWMPLDAPTITAQISTLEGATRDIVEFVDRNVAHHDPRASASSTFAQLDEAIKVVTQLTSDYTRFITGKSNLSMVPVDVTNALQVFRFPWIDPEHPPTLDPGDI